MERRSANIFYSELNLLAADNRSGSNELLSKINNLIIRDLDYIDLNDRFFHNLSDSFRSFEVIQKYLGDLRDFSSGRSKDEIKNYLIDYENLIKKNYDKIFKNLTKEINRPVSVITISNSETIAEVLKLLNNEKMLINLFICESRPQYEGRDLALKLLEHGIRSEIILEAKIPDCVENIDIALFGMDSLLENGNPVNKIGSKLIAICCNHYSKPLYVIGDSLKISKSSKFSQLKRSPHEIWENHPETVSVNNYYFEELDRNLITKIILEI